MSRTRRAKPSKERPNNRLPAETQNRRVKSELAFPVWSSLTEKTCLDEKPAKLADKELEKEIKKQE